MRYTCAYYKETVWCRSTLFIGLYPLTKSFDLMNSDYLRSLGFNDSYVEGFASHIQNDALHEIYMSYCFASGQAWCRYDSTSNVICKVAGWYLRATYFL